MVSKKLPQDLEATNRRADCYDGEGGDLSGPGPKSLIFFHWDPVCSRRQSSRKSKSRFQLVPSTPSNNGHAVDSSHVLRGRDRWRKHSQMDAGSPVSQSRHQAGARLLQPGARRRFPAWPAACRLLLAGGHRPRPGDRVESRPCTLRRHRGPDRSAKVSLAVPAEPRPKVRRFARRRRSRKRPRR
jgi:hypothetical protein